MTDVQDDALRKAFRSLSHDASFGDGCPAADKLWSGARGELPPAEVEAIALHMAECGACAEAWRVARDFGTPAALPAPKTAPLFPWWAAAAAAILLASGASVFYMSRAPIDPGPGAARTDAPAFVIPIEKAPVVVAVEYALTMRGSGGGPQFLSALKAALEPYDRGDFPAAVTALGAVHAQYRDTMEPAFYLGVSQLLSGNASGAVTSLEQARDLASADRRDDVAWFLAAAYERSGRRGDAQRLAQSVCESKGARAATGCTAASALGSRP